MATCQTPGRGADEVVIHMRNLFGGSSGIWAPRILPCPLLECDCGSEDNKNRFLGLFLLTRLCLLSDLQQLKASLCTKASREIPIEKRWGM